jgi:hypothetical protein
MKNWIKDRSKERTSMDGILMIALGVAVLCLAGPILTIAAYAAISDVFYDCFYCVFIFTHRSRFKSKGSS